MSTFVKHTFFIVVIVVLLAFVVGASASAHPFDANVITRLWEALVALFT